MFRRKLLIPFVLCGLAAVTIGSRPGAAADSYTFTPKPPDCGAGSSSAVLWTEGQAIPGCASVAVPIPPEPPGPPAGSYVATNGSDSNPGTFEAPFKTLDKCKTAIRTATPKACWLRAGTYAVPAAGMLWAAADSNQSWAVYPPDGNGSAILSGAGLSPNKAVIWINPDVPGLKFNGLKIVAGSYIPVYSQGNGAIWTNNIFDGLGTNPWYGLDIYGDGLLVANNTIENFRGGSANGIFFQTTGVRNSVVRDNVLRCLSHYGIYVGANSTNNIIARNQIIGIGHVGGAPPGCGPVVDPAGTGINVVNAAGNLFVGNTVDGVEGYTMVLSDTGGANWIESNTLKTLSDPGITLNGAPGTAIVHNSVVSPGSIGFNLGDEHDACPRTNTSNDLFVSNNNFNSRYEPLYVTATRDSTIQGNTGNIGTVATGNPAPHYQAGIALPNWTAAGGCAAVQNSSGNMIRLNRFTSSDAAAQYGVLFEPGQCGNTLAYNVLYPFGAPGKAAIQNNCGGTQTLTGNQTSADAAALAGAPPIAHAGPGSIAAVGQVVSLDGSGSRLITGGSAAGITYAWKQLSGPAVTIAGAGSIKASFTAPAVTKPTIFAFELTASSATGSTTDRVYFGVDPWL